MDIRKNSPRNESVALIVEGKNVKTNPFGENKSGERAYRRAERLVAALHLVTNHVAHDEPLRSRIRMLSPELLSLMLEGRDEMRASESAKMRQVSSLIRELISLVRMLSISGLLSQQNNEILTEALDELWQFVSTSQRSLLSESVRLTRDDLLDVRDRQAPPLSFIKDIKDTESIKDTKETHIQSPEQTTRVENILEVLRAGGALSISDIASNLPQYSEKMIQRALFDLVLADKVKKIGSKRWSRYMLA